MTKNKSLNFLFLYYAIIGNDSTIFVIRLDNNDEQRVIRFAIFFFF